MEMGVHKREESWLTLLGEIREGWDETPIPRVLVQPSL